MTGLFWLCIEVVILFLLLHFFLKYQAKKWLEEIKKLDNPDDDEPTGKASKKNDGSPVQH